LNNGVDKEAIEEDPEYASPYIALASYYEKLVCQINALIPCLITQYHSITDREYSKL
jgi:hypothetical protein